MTPSFRKKHIAVAVAAALSATIIGSAPQAANAGDGGKYVEVFHDVELLIPPVTREEARAAVLRLRIAPLFAGVRGEPALDLDAVCAAVVRLGEVALACGDEIASIDLNPVLVGATGEGIVIVDALVERNIRATVTQ